MIIHNGHLPQLLTHKKAPDVARSLGLVPQGLQHAASWIFLGKQALQLRLVGGWATPLKNMKVNWDDIPNINGKIKNGNQTTNQCLIYRWLVFWLIFVYLAGVS